MTLNDYFALPHTPSKRSPVGQLMLKIVAKQPNIQPEEARELANSLIQKAAGKWNFRMPRIYSDAELKRNAERLKKISKPL